MAKKITIGDWTSDDSLPKMKYYVNERLNMTALAQDISEKLPVKTFKDRVEFDEVVGKILSQVWPRLDKYFSPLVIKPFIRDVHKAVFKHAKIELAGEKKVNEKVDDSRSDTKRFFKTDRT